MPAGPVTRFAPSPTGHLHIGGARTALYSWALARPDGRFLLRIEDTDQARSSDETAHGILEDLAWLGIAWDEGPTFEGLGGDPRGVGPWRQAERLPHYAAAVDALISRDRAYPAFESNEELEALRAAARAEKRNFRYRRAPDFDRAAALARMAREPHVVRFRMPEQPVPVVDRVLGAIEFGEEHLDDFVIRKRDGFPTFHLAVVVDDELMGVTHVLRGQEHLNNTPRHVALQRALGYREPVYAHLPLIFNADGSKMSKRDKDKAAREAVNALGGRTDTTSRERFAKILATLRSEKWLEDKRTQLPPDELDAIARLLDLELPCIEVEDFRRAGYLPDALCNYLALLGWSPGEKDEQGRDRERFDRAYLAEHFSLERIGAGNARFDRDKLLAFNQDAIAALSDEEFYARWSEWCERYEPARFALRDDEWRRWFARIIRTRCRTLTDPMHGSGAFAWASGKPFDYRSAANAKVLSSGSPSGWELLTVSGERLSAVQPFDPEPIEQALGALAQERGVGLGKIAQPLRVAATGTTASPPIGETLALLGREEVARRIQSCLESQDRK
jgi:glutamyl/glutaminyl-tRNA synthetase